MTSDGHRLQREELLQSAIQPRPHVSESAERTFASACKDNDGMAKRADVIAELELPQRRRKLDPSLDWRKWRGRLQVLAESF